MQEMNIYGVSFDLVGKQPIVLLKAADGNKCLPIWIGHNEAAAILMKLQSQESPRPMTHDLLTEMVDQLGPRPADPVFRLRRDDRVQGFDIFRQIGDGLAIVAEHAYRQAVVLQTAERQRMTPSQVKQALSGLILPENFHRRIGPAINAGSSLFLYGPPGNGKTTVAQAIAKLLADTDPIWLPSMTQALFAI